MFDVGFEWGDPPPYGMPVFIVTHEAREPLPMKGGTTYTFARMGSTPHSSWPVLPQATRTSASGAERNIVREYLRAGLLDEMQNHLIPILLGGGVRLFDGSRP